MNDILSENVRDLRSRVTETGKAIGEQVLTAAVASSIAAGQAQKMVQDATEVAAAGVGQAKTMLGDAGDAAQQAWSQAGNLAEDAVDAGRRATRSASRQIHENPLMAVLIGIAFACIASLWFRGAGSNAKARLPRRSRVAAPPKK